MIPWRETSVEVLLIIALGPVEAQQWRARQERIRAVLMRDQCRINGAHLDPHEHGCGHCFASWEGLE